MGIRYEDMCCGCATESYPCLGNSCSNRNVPVAYCDWCDEESDDLYYVGSEVVCKDCVVENLDDVLDRVNIDSYLDN